LKGFAKAVRKARLSDRVDLMRQSVADNGEQVAWELVRLALTKNVRGLASTIKTLPDSCLWGPTFNNDLPRSFFTGVIEPKPDAKPVWMADLTHGKLLEQCRKLKTDWPLPDIGGVYDPSQKIRELKAGLTTLRIASPATPELRDGFIEQMKGTAADNRKLFDDFHASVDLIVAAIMNSITAAPIDVPTVPSNDTKTVEPKADKPPSADDAGGGQSEADSKPAKWEASEEHLYRFERKPEIVQVCGFGESVPLERTEGVERLIAIVTRRRVNVMELARIGAPQQGRDRSSVDVDADRLSERESINDERFESRLGDDALSGVLEAVYELIEQRDAAAARGDDQEADKLTAQINAALERSKSDIRTAAAAVKKSLDRTYKRLRKGDHGKKLAGHFHRFVKRPRNESDYVYPDESHGKVDEIHGKIVWFVK
jgi:hypothetical protein